MENEINSLKFHLNFNILFILNALIFKKKNIFTITCRPLAFLFFLQKVYVVKFIKEISTKKSYKQKFYMQSKYG